MSKLIVNGVTCYYEDFMALGEVSLTADRGDFVGLLGPNGSGKTTLIRSISRTLKPHAGTVFLDDEDVYRLKSKESGRKMAVVPQNGHVGFDFTALEVVLMGRTPHLGRFESEKAEDLQVARDAMETTNTWQFRDRYITELSGGERQRVIIARALAQQPSILLLDEATAHLDISYQMEIMDLLKNLIVDRGLTVLSAIHNLNLAAQYCDYIVMLKEGRILAMGPSEEVLTPENIGRAFQTQVMVKRHPVTDALYVTHVPGSRPTPSSNETVHIICGGGAGSRLMHALLKRRYNVTAGVINAIDTDYEAAEYLGIDVAEEAPMSPISDQAHKRNLALIERADLVVLADVPFGHGNLRNLEAAKSALEMERPLVLIDETPVRERDFTDGKAEELFNELKERSMIAKSFDEVLGVIGQNLRERS